MLVTILCYLCLQHHCIHCAHVNTSVVHVQQKSLVLKVGCHGPRMRTEIYRSANLTLNLQVDSEYVVA